MVEVKIIRATNLMKKDFMGKADPYVKIQLVNTMLSKTTRAKMNTLNPEWNQTFKLSVQDLKSQSLELQVFDWEKVCIFKPFISTLFSCSLHGALSSLLSRKCFMRDYFAVIMFLKRC